MLQLLSDRLAASGLTLLLLAQNKNGNKGLTDSIWVWAWVPIVMVLFYFMLWRPQQRERAEQQKKLESLKKNDRVILQSGIVGTIFNVESGARYVTIKVDESTNTKLKVLKSAIATVLTGDEDEEGKQKEG